MEIPDKLKISAAVEARKIEHFIRFKQQEMANEGLLIGLSGGLDSAVTAFLAVRAVGADRVHLLNLIEMDSSPAHQRDAQVIADQLGIPLGVRNMTPTLRQLGAYRLLPFGNLPVRKFRSGVVHLGRRLLGLNQIEDILQARLNHRGNSYLSRANASAMSKHRLRMLMLYQQAEIYNWLVVGAANRTEWLTGTFSKWGCDHCADIMPLLHLYRTQVEQLAEFLEVPVRIREKTADPDILPGVNDKAALLGSFEESDLILFEFEEGIALDDIKLRHNPQTVERIFKLFQLSTPMRAIPYQLARE